MAFSNFVWTLYTGLIDAWEHVFSNEPQKNDEKK